MNKLYKKLLTASAGLVIALSAGILMPAIGNANPPCYQYNQNGFQTSQTPVFNNICNITSPLSSNQGSYPLGDEPNFVRIRPHASDNPVGSANPPLVDNLSGACNAGDKFDIWTYVHNDAEPDFNNNGSGTAVAHDVKLALSAPTNTTNNKFTFGATVSASNAASVSDTTTLTCNGQQVKLTLVPSSVHYNNDLSQTAYSSLSDSAVNGTTTLGNPTWGSGTVWGCWNYRVVVVYTVTVQKVQTPPATGQCLLLQIAASDNRKVKVSQFQVTATNAALKSVVLDWGDTHKVTLTSANNVIGQSHQYSDTGTFEVSAIATFSVTGQADIVSGGPGTSCSEKVTFTPNQPPIVVPPQTPPTVTTVSTPPAPTELVNTGAGSTIGIFAAVTAIGAFAHRWFLSRRLSRQ